MQLSFYCSSSPCQTQNEKNKTKQKQNVLTFLWNWSHVRPNQTGCFLFWELALVLLPPIKTADTLPVLSCIPKQPLTILHLGINKSHKMNEPYSCCMAGITAFPAKKTMSQLWLHQIKLFLWSIAQLCNHIIPLHSENTSCSHFLICGIQDIFHTHRLLYNTGQMKGPHRLFTFLSLTMAVNAHRFRMAQNLFFGSHSRKKKVFQGSNRPAGSSCTPPGMCCGPLSLFTFLLLQCPVNGGNWSDPEGSCF